MKINIRHFLTLMPNIILFLASFVMGDLKKINSNPYISGFSLNDHGQAVWYGQGDSPLFSDRKLNFYDGSNGVVVAETNWAPWVTDVEVNNSGQVAWTNGYQIFLYENGVSQPISGLYNRVYNIDINNKGDIAWQADEDIFLYRANSIQQISPQGNQFVNFGDMNNNGAIVYGVFDNGDFDVYLYDGASSQRLTDDLFADAAEKINDSGQIVWPSNNNLLLYDSGQINQIATSDSYNWDYYISDAGNISWRSPNADGYQVYYYSNGNVQRLTNDYFNILLDMNDNGDVVWANGNYSRMYLYNGESTQDITPQLNELITSVQLSNSGQLAYLSASSIYLTDLPQGHDAQPVPEPATLLLLGAGLPSVILLSRRNRR